MAYGNGDYVGQQQGPILGLNQPQNATTPTNGGVTQGLAHQQQALDVLHNVLTELEKRLASVLVPSGPTTNAAGIGQSGAALSSPMAEGLRMLGYRADGAIARVQDIISRLEL